MKGRQIKINDGGNKKNKYRDLKKKKLKKLLSFQGWKRRKQNAEVVIPENKE